LRRIDCAYCSWVICPSRNLSFRFTSLTFWCLLRQG